MAEPVAFYVAAGPGRFESTIATAGPWSAEAQHGGPPSALLARAMEAAGEPGQRLARLTVEILRPLPIAVVEVEAAIVRPGRRVTMVEGRLAVDGTTYILARAWRMARGDTSAAALGAASGVPAIPAPAAPAEWPGAFEDGYMRAMDTRFTAGAFGGRGPGAAWLRPRLPLLEGEPLSPAQRAALVADSGSGVSHGVDYGKWLAINVEMTLSLHRDPAGDWIHLDSDTVIGPEGTGRTDTVLRDPGGEVGRALQTLLVAPRAAAAGPDC